MSKDEVSFVASLHIKGDLGGSVWKRSTEHGHSHCGNVLENCTDKALGWWERFHLLKHHPRDVSVFIELLKYKILWTVKKCNASCGIYLPISVLFLFCVRFFMFKLQTVQSKSKKLPSCVFSLSCTLFIQQQRG